MSSDDLEVIKKECLLLDLLPMGTMVIREDLEICFWNRCLEEWTEINRENVFNHKLTDVFPELSESKVKINRLKTVFSHGSSIVLSAQLHKYFVIIDGPFETFRFHETYISPITFSCNLDHKYAVILLEDVSTLLHSLDNYATLASNLENEITRRHSIQKEKEKMQIQIFHSAKLASIGIFAGGIGHEINNPLTVAKGNLDLIQGRIKSSKEIKDLDMDWLLKKIDTQITSLNRIADIVNKLGEYSVETASDKVGPFDVIQSLETTLSFVENIYQHKHQITIKKINNSTKSIVVGNVGKMNQVFINLISNAKDALIEKNNPENREITIQIKNEDDYILLEFSDLGVGIDQKNLENIFDSFYTTKSPGNGTGLGLSIVYAHITEMQGFVTVDSIPNVGTTFTLKLPAFHTNEEDA